MSHFDIMAAPLKGPHLIDASAGTGKTFTISGLVVRMIVELQWPIEDILVVTFTEAAANDLKGRIREMIGEVTEAFKADNSDDMFISRLVSENPDHQRALGLLNIALQNFDEAAIFTIHGFCQKVLKDNFLECGQLLEAELVTDQWRIIREITEDFFRTNFYEISPLFASYSQQRLLPEKLRKFLGVCYSRDDLRIIPEIDRLALVPIILEAEKNFTEKYFEVVSAWSSARLEVEKILLEDDGLNRRNYSVKRVPAWLASFELLATSPYPKISLFDSFHKFTTSSITKSTKKDFIPPCHDFFDLCQELLQLRNHLTDLYEMMVLDYRKDLYDFVRKELLTRKKVGGFYSFDDMLKGLSDALKGPYGRELSRIVSAKYRAALIDEFQDTDPLQYEIFHTIFSGRNSLLFFIGDPKQSIYSFRGADIFAYMKAVGDVGSRFTLGHNWRSVPGLINATNTLFNSRRYPFLFGEIPFEPVQAADKENEPFEIDGDQQSPFQLVALKRLEHDDPVKLLGKEEARKRILAWTANEISQLVALGQEGRANIGEYDVHAGDIAVLVRTNREARQVRKALLEVGVASVLHSSESLFTTREAEELLLVLEALADPADSRKLRSALVTRMIGFDGRELDIMGEAQDDLSQWIEKFRAYHKMWLSHGFGLMFSHFLTREEVSPRLLRASGGERVVTNLLHMYELLYHVSGERRLGVTGLCKYLSGLINETMEDVPDEYQLRLESEAELVQIVTIHKAKGLQYPIVFCPFSWEGSKIPKIKNGKLPADSKGLLYHDSRRAFQLTLDIGSSDIPAGREAAFREELAEGLRLLYVALTRAVQRCYFFWGPIKEAGTSAAAYLLHGKDKVENEEIAFDHDILATLTDEEMMDDLARLGSVSGGDIEVKDMDFRQSPATKKVPGEETLRKCPEFCGRIDHGWSVSSFSSITDVYFNRVSQIHTPLEDKEYGDLNYYDDFRNFPRGAGPGTFLHSLLEGLDFKKALDDTGIAWVRKCLMRSGYEVEWEMAIREMLANVLNTPLQDAVGGVYLADVGKGDRLDELEFYFPIESLDTVRIHSLFSEILNIQDFDGLSNARKEPIRGMMKGYIDLVFYQNGRFHIVDWKSNFLGYADKDYALEELNKVMTQEKYCLQYLIYAVALHRYLENRIPGYDYDVHFGGVHYLFLRGIDLKAGAKGGVYYARPDKKMILEATRILVNVNN